MPAHYSITFKQGTLNQSLEQLGRQTGMLLAWDPSQMPAIQMGERFFKNQTAEDILNGLIYGTGLVWKRVERQYIIKRDSMQVPVRRTIAGYIRQSNNREDISGASVQTPEGNTAVLSNEYGFFSIQAGRQTRLLRISHAGFQTRQVYLSSDERQNRVILLDPTTITTPNISVNDSAAGTVQAGFSSIQGSFSLRKLQKLPLLGGERDIVKMVQNEQGVSAQTEGSSGMFVRGGDQDQNLVLLDEALVYNPSHIFGLVSIFNADALRNVTFYKEYLPASYGGRLSSVLDTRMADGDFLKTHMHGGLSLLSANLSVEGPLEKEKSSFYFSARRSLIDLLSRNLHYGGLNSSYYDLNLKLNYRLSPSNRIFLSVYQGTDHIFSENTYQNTWGNLISTLRWNHLFSDRLFMNLSAIYSRYNNRLNIGSDTIAKPNNWMTGVRDFNLKADFSAWFQRSHTLRFGLSTTLHQFEPGETQLADTNGYYKFNIPREASRELSLYLSDRVPLGAALELQAGLRVTAFQNTGPAHFFANSSKYDSVFLVEKPAGAFHTWFSLEPRLSLETKLSEGAHLSIAWTRSAQFAQLLMNNELAFSSLETWVPSSPDLKPARSDAFFATFNLQQRCWSFSATTYYKKFRDLAELSEHPAIIENAQALTQVRPAKGRSYGLELALGMGQHFWQTQVAYTYARAFRQSTYVNNGDEFRARYDLPHTLKASLIYDPGKRVSFSALFNLSSGRPFTQPVGYYSSEGSTVPVYESRNSSRLPLNHHLDVCVVIGPSKEIALRHFYRSTWKLGIYNIYDHRNVLYYRFQTGKTSGPPQLLEASIGISPELSFTFAF